MCNFTESSRVWSRREVASDLGRSGPIRPSPHCCEDISSTHEGALGKGVPQLQTLKQALVCRWFLKDVLSGDAGEGMGMQAGLGMGEEKSQGAISAKS